MHSIDFKNMRLSHILTHKTHDLIVAFGLRSCAVLNSLLEIRQRYLDASKTEKFLCAAFIDLPTDESVSSELPSQNQPDIRTSPLRPSFRTLLALAGDDGIVKLVCLNTGTLCGSLKGHSNSIRNLHYENGILFSSSADSSIRMWNIRTLNCVGLFAGIFGHKDHILSIHVNHDSTLLVSSGTDSTIKQWTLPSYLFTDSVSGPEDPSYHFPAKPFASFSGIHNTAITKVEYYGDFILSLSNNRISAIYNGISLDELGIKCQSPSDCPIFIGNIETYDSCKTFAIVKHMLVALSQSGDIYLFDLRDLGTVKSPFIVKSSFENVIDFSIQGEYIFVITGQSIHKKVLNISQFDNYNENLN